jgi:hypothetical protein
MTVQVNGVEENMTKFRMTRRRCGLFRMTRRRCGL